MEEVSAENLVQIKKSNNQIAKQGVYIKTFGCQMNVYDSEKLLKVLEEEYNPVTGPDDADLIIINTCSVRDKPEQKLYSLLGELGILKQSRPNLMVGVGGCVAQQEGNNIVKRSPVVDFVFGTHNLSLVPGLISARLQKKKPQVAVNYRDEWEDLPLGLTDGSRVSSFVSISRGCNKNCTYCIVPVTRGPEVSRLPEEIEREAKLLVHRGVKEIVLLGQTVNSYGLDLKPRLKFVQLLERLAQIEDLKRIRFTSPHPQEVRQDFFELVAENPKVCKHIHMPLQSGSDVILKAMNRNYRRKRYLDIIEGLKQAVPDIGITTDIIVGFPGETEADFQETLDVMRQVEFDNSYSFMFSPRPGTKAADMSGALPKEEKLRRLQELQALQEELTGKKLKSWVGQIGEVLLDGVSQSDSTKLQGRLSQNILLNITSECKDLEPGQTVEVQVTHASRFTLRGEVTKVVC